MKAILIVTNQLILGQGIAGYIGSRHRLFPHTLVSRTGEAQKLAASMHPKFIVLDMHLLGVEGPHMIASLHRAARPAGIILVLSGDESPAYIRYLLQTPIIGLLTRNCSMNEFLVSFSEADQRHVYVSQDLHWVVSREVQCDDETPGIYVLSKRELEVAKFVAQGYTSAQIGQSMGLSAKTVEVHRYHIFKKLKVTNRCSLINLLKTA